MAGIVGENRPPLPKPIYTLLSDNAPVSVDDIRSMKARQKYELICAWQKFNSYSPAQIKAGQHRLNKAYAEGEYKKTTKAIGEVISKAIKTKAIELASATSSEEYKSKAHSFKQELQDLNWSEQENFAIRHILHEKYY